jgi:lactobin A/cerein 7B family class IIb bacteriocin
MNEEQIKEIFSDKEFVESILALETPEEVQAVLKEKNLDLSITQIEKVQRMLSEAVDENKELTDEDLESVSGGLGFLIAMIVTAITVVTLAAVDTNDSLRRRGRRW